MQAQLLGYDLYKFFDGTYTSPPTSNTTDNKFVPNPAAVTWFPEDFLIFSAFVGSLSQDLVHLIS